MARPHDQNRGIEKESVTIGSGGVKKVNASSKYSLSGGSQQRMQEDPCREIG